MRSRPREARSPVRRPRPAHRAPHRPGLAVSDDTLRQNEIVIGDEKVLRIDLVGMRLLAEMVMAQVCRAHRQLSVRPPARAEPAAYRMGV